MDQKLFEQKLSEVADWKIPETLQETSLNAKKKRGRKTAEERYQEEHEEVFLEMFDGVNPTLTPMLTNVKCAAATCEDCGKHCPNGHHKEKEYYRSNRGHWRERCLTCNMHKNPYTKEFDLTPKQAASVWTGWCKGAKNPGKYIENKTMPKTPLEVTSVIQTETGEIRIYGDKHPYDK